MGELLGYFLLTAAMWLEYFSTRWRTYVRRDQMKFFRVPELRMTVLLLIFCSFLMAMPALTSAMPSPSGRQIINYMASEQPVADDNPSQAKPIGFGAVVSGGDTISVSFGLPSFSGPVDVYVAFVMSADQANIRILNPDGGSFKIFPLNTVYPSFLSGVLPDGILPWKAASSGPINKTLFNNLPAAGLPQGVYAAYVLVTPAGSLADYYLWISRFSISYSMADLAGTWAGNSLGSGPCTPWWERSDMTIAGDGSLAASTLESTGATHDINGGAGTISISTSGVATFSDGAGADVSLEGTMDAGKTVMVWTGTFGGGCAGGTEMKVFTKKAASYSMADLVGTWAGNSLASGPCTPWWERSD